VWRECGSRLYRETRSTLLAFFCFFAFLCVFFFLFCSKHSFAPFSSYGLFFFLEFLEGSAIENKRSKCLNETRVGL
jgi:hypothetical protein